MPMDTDVCIVGGGPAGLAAAIALRGHGFRVTVADGAKPPIVKACGEGLLPDAIEAMQALGITLGESDGYTLRGIRFEDDHASVSAKFPFGKGTGMRREELHARMLERAQDCGASLIWNAPVRRLDPDGVLAGGIKIRAGWVIGADGSRSRVRRWSGLESFVFKSNRFGFRKHYRVAPWSEYIEIHWSKTSQAYVTPVSGHEVCVALIHNSANLRFDGSFRMFPELASRLKGAAQASLERGAVTSMFELKRVARGNVALIGDASGSVDAITGEGLSLSFRQAAALGDALASGDLRNYRRAHRQLLRRPQFMARLLLLLGRKHMIRRRVMRTMEATPQLFERLVAYHIGAARPLQLATAGALLGWRLLEDLNSWAEA